MGNEESLVSYCIWLISNTGRNEKGRDQKRGKPEGVSGARQGRWSTFERCDQNNKLMKEQICGRYDNNAKTQIPEKNHQCQFSSTCAAASCNELNISR